MTTYQTSTTNFNRLADGYPPLVHFISSNRRIEFLVSPQVLISTGGSSGDIEIESEPEFNGLKARYADRVINSETIRMLVNPNLDFILND